MSLCRHAFLTARNKEAVPVGVPPDAHLRGMWQPQQHERRAGAGVSNSRLGLCVCVCTRATKAGKSYCDRPPGD